MMSSSNPWDKFFWNDWDTDPAVKLCSLAAQGLWMRVLCFCAKADPKGYLVVAGRPLSPADLSSLVGKPEPEVELLLRELSHYGVFSTDRSGRIYNRRMVRDVKKARTAVENGRKGGNPNLSKYTANSASDNPVVIPMDKPHKPLAISQELERKASLRSVARGGKPKFLTPDWIPQKQWSAFLEMRNRKRKPMTDHAMEILVAKLDKLRSQGHDPGAVLDQTIEHAWDSVFELKPEASHENGTYNGRRDGLSPSASASLAGAAAVLNRIRTA